MRRILLPALVVAMVVGVQTDPTYAMTRLGPVGTPGELASTAQVVVVGKVTAIEKELVEVPSPHANEKTTHVYKIAVVKVETPLFGADKLKEVKVGTYHTQKVDPNQKGLPPIVLPPATVMKEGQQVLLFLTKNWAGDFYHNGSGIPVDVTTAKGKKALEDVKKVVAVRADPLKALKSDKAVDRAFAAVVMATHYCSHPAVGLDADRVAIDAEESKLILKGLTEADWRGGNKLFDNPPNPVTAFSELRLGYDDADKWIEPVIVNVPGKPDPDWGIIQKDAFTKWLAGPGKDYVVKKWVPKKK